MLSIALSAGAVLPKFRQVIQRSRKTTVTPDAPNSVERGGRDEEDIDVEPVPRPSIDQKDEDHETDEEIEKESEDQDQKNEERHIKMMEK